MKYRSIALLLIAFMLLSSGCVIKNNIPQNERKALEIVTTNFPAYDFTMAVAGDMAKVHMLIKPGSEVHSYDPTPGDIQLINECDIFIYNGGESDSWVDSVLNTINNPDMQIVKMMDYVNNLEEEYSEGMQLNADNHGHSHQSEERHSSDHYEHNHEYDEHVWTSPVNAMDIVKAITAALMEVDAANKDYYMQSCDSYLTELQLIHQDFCDVVNNGKRKVIVFGDRFPLLHFTKEYGLEYYAAYPGCAEESEPDVGTVAFLIEKVMEESIPAVFHLEMSNEKMADTICEESGAQKLMFSSCHNVTAEQFEQGITYIDLMKDNVKALRTALN